MIKKLLTPFLALWIAIPAFAQVAPAQSFTIKGQVSDSLSNESVPFATLIIVLADKPEQPVKMLASDKDGRFETTLTTPGAYLISAQFIGKTTVQKEFTLVEGIKTVDLGTLNMAEDALQLGQVTVTAQRPLVRVDIDRIAYSIEADPEAKVNNLLEMLRKVPLVTVDGEDKIQLKGSSNFVIYMNGKPSNLLANNPSEVLKSMPASSVKDIEVITDPGAKYDAEGIGGVINIITHKNSSLEGVTGTVRANATTVGHFGGGAHVSAKIGKLGLTAHYSYDKMDSPWHSPWNTTQMERENLLNDHEHLLLQDGRYRQRGSFQFGFLEATYEIDSLNLLSVGAGMSHGDIKIFDELGVQIFDRAGSPVYSYDRNSTKRELFGSRNVNVDYQRATRRKDELLTLSYRFSDSPNDYETYTDIFDVAGYVPPEPYPQQNNYDASTREHTGQFDYTTPLWKKHTLETGIKYINRQSRSETIREAFANDAWHDITRDDAAFRHTQHIYSGYLGYALRLESFGVKAGVRAEGTDLNVKFANAPKQNFQTDYFNVVPNVTLSYKLGDSRQFRLGYNMRISRPGIRHLNPYVNDSDPQNIRFGNPHLDAEKSNNISLNYSSFAQKISINASLNYTFVNNAIEQYTFIDPATPEIAQTTYGNLGNRQQLGGYLYVNWSPTSKLRIDLNGGLNYMDLESRHTNMANSGWIGNIALGGQYTFPKDIRFHVRGGYSSPSIHLQGEGSPFYYLGFSLAKDFLEKKLTVSLNTQNPFFWKNMKSTNTSSDDTFRVRNTSYRNAQMFGINISYRFGSLKEPIRKVQRGINNDDVKNGGDTSGQ